MYGNPYIRFLHKLLSLCYTTICTIFILVGHILLPQNKQTRKSIHLANMQILLSHFCQRYIPKYILPFNESLYVPELGDVQCLFAATSVSAYNTHIFRVASSSVLMQQLQMDSILTNITLQSIFIPQTMLKQSL